MEPKPSRLPRRITVQPSHSSPLTTRMFRSGRLGGQSETYRTSDSSLRHDSEFPDSSPLRSTSRDWLSRERESIEPSWKTPSSSYQRCSGTYDRPVSGSFLGNRSRVSTASSQPSWYDPLERTQSTYTGLGSQQDRDSKRPKLSYSGCTPLNGGSTTNSGYTSTPDSSSRYARFPRTSSMVFHSDLSRDRDRRTDTAIHELGDYGHRNSDITPSYLQDRVSSYAQGARPKDTSLSTVRLNTSVSRQLPSQSPSLTRDSSRSSRTTTYRDLRSPQRDISSEVHHSASRREGTPRSTPGRMSPSPVPRSDQTTDGDGRRTTRHLLSRLASSMSSTFFSRRSSQDSSSGRSQDVEEAHSSLHVTPEPSPANSEVLENRPSEQSQGFAFLRRRRWGLSSVSPNQSSDSDAESYRSEDSETRTSGSWLPSSFRNRCTPLFSRRRREGRDETARASSTSDTSRIHNPFRRSSQEDSLDEAQRNPQGAAAAARSSPLSSASPSSSSAAASIAETLFSRRNSGISGMLPNSLLHFSVPAALGNSLSDNVMITVDIVPSGRTSDGHESEKAPDSSRDPEKLKKIKESLLLEDSEEDEGDLCRICQTGASSPSNPFIEPCKCSGSLQYVHQDCMKKWLHAKINSGSNLETITTCELCKEKLDLNLEDFDIQELYQAHANERAEYEFISSGLYLVVLLHLCEQRFSDILGAANEANTRVRFINLARTLQAHMEDLDTSDDSEDERV
ncbi:PREDICTED: E3 ubiquitin-protein ligase MARCH7 [Nanorana parkeri]|uniref:E3 ubiquitin-protein ligase MARCH7 n=1 Tax=Nanorana parkeri TaxID=125878 RepID=UPI000854C6BF|nr:PREDICTED: E3 ubiquitin-protein ligase MARCH7 [Nanorana parkeri]XP_018408664.1 PREDICTED: E3 ubiquitin-protein ligase MARCH7 [Nanorana parkeri]XP_018408665.1 PREDICTED: E3 ubiquitin-protein ligase MARCH7 [Nanorana parkeri]